MDTLEKKVDDMHKHIKTLLENNIDVALSKETHKELVRLDEFLQWMKAL